MFTSKTLTMILVSSSVVPGQVPTYDSGAQIRAMQDSNPGKPVAPKDFQLKTDVPLTSTAQEAVEVSQKWRDEKNAPAAGSDGRVMYTFGAGLPTIVCAPLRVCMIELQAGEKIEGEPQVGDSVRWNISPAVYGTGDQATAVIVLKPHVSGLDTNLLVTTDRRAYYLRLISKPEEYVARVAFQYPNDDNAEKWRQQRLELKNVERQKDAPKTLPALVTAARMNFGYKVTGGTVHIRPLRVFDDGAKTYIQMPSELQHREAPALVILGNDGKGEMTNYRVQEQTYIVDRLFDHAQLVLGSGKKARKVEIIRENRG
jgi:P-type conjugative transfer protein TrbG